MSYAKLLGRIVEKYGTQQKFADAMEMNPASLNLRLNGKAEWKISEMVRACELLDVPLEEAAFYFFTRKT